MFYDDDLSWNFLISLYMPNTHNGCKHGKVKNKNKNLQNL
jgi:hypothetical protein